MSVIKGGLAVNTKELIKEQKVLDTTINRIKDQTYFITELLEKKKENMKTGNTATGDMIAYRRGARDQQLLKRAENEPLFYMYLLLYEKPASFKHIVVDEAQDLSYLHFASLQKITKTMTILGDKDQSIFMEYGQYDWSK
jgi:DNA helicase IV